MSLFVDLGGKATFHQTLNIQNYAQNIPNLQLLCELELLILFIILIRLCNTVFNVMYCHALNYISINFCN